MLKFFFASTALASVAKKQELEDQLKKIKDSDLIPFGATGIGLGIVGASFIDDKRKSISGGIAGALLSTAGTVLLQNNKMTKRDLKAQIQALEAAIQADEAEKARLEAVIAESDDKAGAGEKAEAPEKAGRSN